MGDFPSLVDPATIANPYPVYQRLREEDPVHWDDELQTWVLTQYEDIEAALRDPRLSSNRVDSLRNVDSPEVPEATRQALKATLSLWMLFLDPPTHTRLRNLANKVFTPRVVENLKTHIEDIVRELLTPAAPVGRLDVVRDFAYPLPAIVIAEMLGVRREDRELVKRWSDALAVLLGGAACEPSIAEKGARSILEFRSYLGDLVEERRRRPQSGLITAALRAEDQGSLLSHDELLANCVLLLSAGHETTTNLIGNGVLALLRHPDQLRRLRAEPGLIKTAVEELLRFDSPVQATGRLVTEDFEIGGRLLRKGQGVLLVLAAANRDPARFPHPDSLDLGRANNHHGAFAFGPHYCLGAPLARLEAQIAIPALFASFPDLRLATDEVEWHQNFVLRGLKALPARTGRA
jgi:cytochrome P450